MFLLMFTLTACSQQSATALLSRKWDKNRQDFYYDVYETVDGEKKLIGGMRLYMQYYNYTDVETKGRGIIPSFKGHVTAYTVNMTLGGEPVTIESEAVILGDGSFKPKYSYKKITEGDNLVYEINAEYTSTWISKNYEYTLKRGGKDDVSGKMKLNGTYYDNEMLFALVRACPLDDMGDDLNLAINVASPLDDLKNMIAMKVINVEGTAVVYQKVSALEREEGLGEEDFISVSDAKHFKYVPAKNDGSSGMEMFFAKTEDFMFSNKPTYIPVLMRQNGLEYVLCKTSEAIAV
jgi:hypothetical protein